MAACMMACLGFREVRCVTVHSQNHVACSIGDAGILVCHGIVKELVDLLQCVLCGVCLLGGEGTECCEHGTVNGSGIVEKYSNDLLDKGFVLFVERG